MSHTRVKSNYTIIRFEDLDTEQISKHFDSLIDIKETFTQRIINQRLQIEEDCIKKVIEAYIGKSLSIEDAKKVNRVFKVGVEDKYILVYDNNALGMIHLLIKGSCYTVRFIPDEINC